MRRVDKMDRCKSCKHYDKKMSKENWNENWVICPVMPSEVMISGTSKDCKEYEKLVTRSEHGEPQYPLDCKGIIQKPGKVVVGKVDTREVKRDKGLDFPFPR